MIANARKDFSGNTIIEVCQREVQQILSTSWLAGALHQIRNIAILKERFPFKRNAARPTQPPHMMNINISA